MDLPILTERELFQAQHLISNCRPGIYELKAIFDDAWDRVPSPTEYGLRFKATVNAGLLMGIRHVGVRSDNHNLYEIF